MKIINLLNCMTRDFKQTSHRTFVFALLTNSTLFDVNCFLSLLLFTRNLGKNNARNNCNEKCNSFQYIIKNLNNVFGYYDKDWALMTNKSEKLNTLSAIFANKFQTAQNAEQVYLFGEECLQKHLKQSNGKCPIQQHNVIANL
ncbi:hypothetical protein RFI_02435 [Reticulomyxa filosa]|uniref:Uncharacterized protein n=1 Tax=Reticulomyxa filosa TaxID=46433 RepID=X6P9B0_RETFI|nr:hypothetical protein RFI_02435 [Reticulomyxa filosa]|eukprot:ETO34654.1 hypothetical protein RFI_02435 [Reticulomyxa filosa]